MKIALCFSGQARSFERGYDFYRKNLLDILFFQGRENGVNNNIEYYFDLYSYI
jgi:hypothetical protein